MGEWISVTDRLPENNLYVDVYLRSHDNPDYGRRKTSIVCIKGSFRVQLFASCEYVSHWMPAPKPPEDKS